MRSVYIGHYRGISQYCAGICIRRYKRLWTGVAVLRQHPGSGMYWMFFYRAYLKKRKNSCGIAACRCNADVLLETVFFCFFSVSACGKLLLSLFLFGDCCIIVSCRVLFFKMPWEGAGKGSTTGIRGVQPA